ncbi:MAG: VOC family protein [Myxococcales bacterium]|nr:VOC family protein [Myxococcales bacterium]
MSGMHPFHLAFPVYDIGLTRAFYVDVLGCEVGREGTRWIDFNFFGHQLTAHLTSTDGESSTTNDVDGDKVPTRHFGAILPWESWHELAERLKTMDLSFRILPRTRFVGEVGEQATMFFDDPSGNTLELKSFKDPGQIFARWVEK